MPSISARRSTDTARKSCWRANASSRCVNDCAAFGALHRAIDQPLQARIVRQTLAQQIEVAHHGHQQIVEVVRDAAGKLADGFHLLRLTQLFLRLLARGHRLDQIGRPLLDALLQRRGQFRQRGAFGGELGEQIFAIEFGSLARGDVGANADQRLDAAVGPIDRPAAHVDPVQRTVGPDIAEFDVVVMPLLDRARDAIVAVRAIVGMNGALQVLIRERSLDIASKCGLAARRGFEDQIRQMQLPACRVARP